MALILNDYTDYDTIRGLLGVAETEIPDDVLVMLDGVNLQEVTFTLEELNSSITTKFEAIKLITVSSRSALQTRFYNVVRLYASYIVANQIANGSVEMFAPKRIEDGKAATERVADPYLSLREALKASLTAWKARLSKVLTALDPAETIAAAPTRLMASSTGLAVDPVTGV